MDWVISSKGRALGPLALGLLAALSLSGPAFAQEAANLAASGASATELTQELTRAEALFGAGHTALREGRETDAREAFDAALDVFVAMRGPAATDPLFLPAYRSLVDRISAAEVEAGATRRTVPFFMAPSPRAPEAAELTAAPAPSSSSESQPEGILEELGARIEAITPTDEARQSNEAVLVQEIIDLPIELNDQVLGAIDLYTGRFRKWFSAALSRGLPHLPRIREILAEAGIPQDLAYVPIVESAFNPAALSRARAKGLWQFIPSTGKQYGLKQDFFIDERSNMEKATLAAAQYLKNLYALFGDWNLALAGYNAGEGRVQRAIRKAKTSDFWALAKTRSFRAETKNYVPLIHAAIVIAKSPESYGIDLVPEELSPAETVRMAGSYPIATVAKCAGAEPAEIRLLNPELRRGITPSGAFDLSVPKGSGEQVSLCLAGERAMDFTRHVVRKRDTFSKIAAMFGVAGAEIARINSLTLKSRLRPGMELAIPRRAHTALTQPSARPDTALGKTSYRIQKGDTLSHVAARHNTTVEAIKALNGLNSSRLSIGQVLRVASATSAGSQD